MNYRFGPFVLSVARRTLEVEGKRCPVGSRAFDILAELVRHPGTIIGKRQLIAKAWPDVVVEENALRFHIAALRSALGAAGERTYIVNAAGRGYCFVAPVEVTPGICAHGNAQPDLLTPQVTSKVLIGRDEDLKALCGRVGSTHLTSLVAGGGTGKTCLARAVAAVMEDHFPGGVCFLDLSDVQQSQDVTTLIAQEIERIRPVRDAETPSSRECSQHRILLILDNCEHLVGAVARAVSEMRMRSTDIHVLATSREALGLAGEQVVLLKPLGHPPESRDIRARELDNYPACRLLMERVAEYRGIEGMTETDAVAIGKICRLVDGLPLALEIVALRVRSFGLPQVAELLEGQHRLGWNGYRVAPHRHRSLRNMLDWSFLLLNAQERTLLQHLSHFDGDFALQDLPGLHSLVRADLHETLHHLVCKSLVDVLDEGPNLSYRLPHTTRAYLRASRLSGSGHDRDQGGSSIEAPLIKPVGTRLQDRSLVAADSVATT